MINFAENLNKMITAGLGGETEAPRTEVAVGHRLQYLDASGPVASFETNIVAPLRKLLVNMLPNQAGSGDPAPDNIRPISGRDSVTVTRAGKNLIDPELFKNIQSWNIIRLKLKPNTVYILSSTIPADTTELPIYFRDVGGSQTAANKVYDGHPVARRTDADGAVEIVQRRISGTDSFSNYNIQLEEGMEVTTYEPYDGASVTIQLGQTVYGGTLDVNTGRVTVTHEVHTVSETTWTATETPNVFRTIYENKGERTAGLISSGYKTISPTISLANMSDLSLKANNNRRYVYVKDSRYATVEEFAAAQASTQIAYELYTPLYLEVEPQQITALIGENNVWSDAGDVDVTYTYYEETEGY